MVKKTTITFMDTCDVLVCGSTLFACNMALEAAGAGHHTTLAMERLHPFYEGVCILNPWVRASEKESFRGLLGNSIDEPVYRTGDRLYVSSYGAPMEIEDKLCEAGVRILYNSPVAAALTHEGRLYGAVFAGKPGLYAVEARLLIDAAVNGTLARVSGVETKEPEKTGKTQRAFYSLERIKPKPCEDNSLAKRFTASNGFALHIENRFKYTSFTAEYPMPEETVFGYSDEFSEIFAAVLEYEPNLPTARLRGADAFLKETCVHIETRDGIPARYDNLRVYSPLSIPGNKQGQFALLDKMSLFKAFDAEARQETLSCVDKNLESPSVSYVLTNATTAVEAHPNEKSTDSFCDKGTAYPNSQKREVSFSVPEAYPAKPLTIAGGGCCGTGVIAAADDRGIDTLCIDNAAALGGTNSVGGVCNLWYGSKTKAFADNFTRIGAENDANNAPAFFDFAHKSKNISLVFLTAICGTEVEGRSIKGLYICTPTGLAKIAVDKCIDATGDGSLAGWSGCEYHFGNTRDEMTLWASLGIYAGGASRRGYYEAWRQFLSPCDERDPMDTARLVQSMRRFEAAMDAPKEQQASFSPSFLLTPRETRHIHCEYMLKYEEMVAGRKFEDGVMRFESNMDSKGLVSSDVANCGIITQDRFFNFRLTLPYRSMLPREIDNLLVAAKSYGAFSDVFAMARMERDLFQMGLVAGTAANEAMEGACSFGDIDIKKFQEKLIEMGSITRTDITPDDIENEHQAIEELEILSNIEDIEEDDNTLRSCAKLLVWAINGNSLPPVNLLKKHTYPLMCVYAILGDDTALDYHEKLLNEELAKVGDSLPQNWLMLTHHKKTPHNLPDHGYAPPMAYWMNVLARGGRKESILQAMKKLVKPIYYAGELNWDTLWSYSWCFAYCAEHLASEAFTDVLMQIIDTPLLQSAFLRRQADLRTGNDTLSERKTYLRLCLARALARCGSRKGYEILIEFLSSAYACFARSARDELAELCSEDFYFDGDKWTQWLELNTSSLKVCPYTKELN